MYTHTLTEPLLYTHKHPSSLAREFLSVFPNLLHAQRSHSTFRLTFRAVGTVSLVTQCTEVVSGASLFAQAVEDIVNPGSGCVCITFESFLLWSVCQEVTATAGNSFVHWQNLIHAACQGQG